MNSVNITGRLTGDPELRSLPSGESVCKLRLAVEGMSPGGEAGYVNVSAFGKPGEAAARVLPKGWLKRGAWPTTPGRPMTAQGATTTSSSATSSS